MIAGDIQCEVCVDSVAGAVAAERGGADRVELCANLLEGGTTPSAGMIRAVLDAIALPVMVMVRPRGGDFVFDSDELLVMCRDLEFVLPYDRIGLVIGALTPDGQIDMPTCRQLCDLGGERSITFHRAFDHTRDPFEALERLIELSLDRVLTSGQSATAEQGIPLLRELVRVAQQQITIMPGAGIRPANARQIVARTGAREIHFSASATVDSGVIFKRPDLPMRAQLLPGDYVRGVTLESQVFEICRAARSDADISESP